MKHEVGQRISISWTAAHRRSSELAAAFGFDSHFVRGRASFLPVRYLQQWTATRTILRRERPEAVVVMQPPPFALFAVAWYCKRNGATLIGDLHTGAFTDPKWRWSIRSVLALLRRYGFAVVPNSELADWCQQAGVDAYVCAARISPAPAATVRVDRSLVLVPLSYSFDEPVDEVLQAAAKNPDLQWVLTGRAPEHVKGKAPANVRFSGFVSADEYLELRDASVVMVALTTVESTMQSVGFEALSAAKPLVTSPTRVLKDYFGDAVVYAEPDAGAIAEAVASAVRQAPDLERQMLALRESKISAQDGDFAAVLTAIADR